MDNKKKATAIVKQLKQAWAGVSKPGVVDFVTETVQILLFVLATSVVLKGIDVGFTFLIGRLFGI